MAHHNRSASRERCANGWHPDRDRHEKRVSQIEHVQSTEAYHAFSVALYRGEERAFAVLAIPDPWNPRLRKKRAFEKAFRGWRASMAPFGSLQARTTMGQHHRHSKRAAFVTNVKSSDRYRSYIELTGASGASHARAVTPDPWDTTIPKRQWEHLSTSWHRAIASAVPVAQTSSDSDTDSGSDSVV